MRLTGFEQIGVAVQTVRGSTNQATLLQAILLARSPRTARRAPRLERVHDAEGRSLPMLRALWQFIRDNIDALSEGDDAGSVEIERQRQAVQSQSYSQMVALSPQYKAEA